MSSKKENKVETKEINTQTEVKPKSKKKSIILIVILLLVVVGGVVFYIRYHNEKKEEEAKIAEQNKANEIYNFTTYQSSGGEPIGHEDKKRLVTNGELKKLENLLKTIILDNINYVDVFVSKESINATLTITNKQEFLNGANDKKLAISQARDRSNQAIDKILKLMDIEYFKSELNNYDFTDEEKEKIITILESSLCTHQGQYLAMKQQIDSAYSFCIEWIDRLVNTQNSWHVEEDAAIHGSIRELEISKDYMMRADNIMKAIDALVAVDKAVDPYYDKETQ
jgi:organic radical activating enzyme